jgi:hypothetical protein
VIIVRGESGFRGILSINGRQSEFVFANEEVAQVESGGVSVLAVTAQLADRTWFADGRILIGPAYVGEAHKGQHDCWLDAKVRTIYTISPEGQHGKIQVKIQPTLTGEVRLNKWIALPLQEMEGGDHGWRDVGSPRSVESLGGYYNYVWYRASYSSDYGGQKTLFFTDAADRLHVFLNQRKVERVWGRGHGATRDPLTINLESGRNDFLFLCDNMGRSAEGDGYDMKGIWGDVYAGAAQVSLKGATWESASAPPREQSWQYKTSLLSG